MIDMLKQVRETIESRGLIRAESRVLAAVSGGADSVCLLHVLLQLQEACGFSVCAAHLHHGLRGEEADGDEAFVRELCRAWQLPLFVRHCDIRAMAAEAGVGLEEAGRRARYAFFHELLKQEGLDAVATAHHGGDNVETVLMRLLRGTGPRGLAGIPYQNGAVIRPLLDVTRRDIEAYLAEYGLSFRTDSTNNSKDFTRNRIRHRLLPMLEQEFNPHFGRNFQEQIQVYADCAAYIENETEKLQNRVAQAIFGGYCFDCEALLQEPPFLVAQLFHKLIESLSAERETGMRAVRAVEGILHNKQGQVSLAKNLTAQICHGKLYIQRMAEVSPFFYELSGEGRLPIPETGGVLAVRQAAEVPFRPKADEVYLDAEKLAGKRLILRSRRPGDFFYPVGMTGKKTLHKFFIDNKVPRFMRDAVPLLLAEEDIVWVAGMRADARYAAPKGAHNAICITYCRGDNDETS